MNRSADLSYYLHLRMIRIDVSNFAVLAIAIVVAAEFIKAIGVEYSPIVMKFKTYAKQVV